jgi:hypothetical protein
MIALMIFCAAAAVFSQEINNIMNRIKVGGIKNKSPFFAPAYKASIAKQQ